MLNIPTFLTDLTVHPLEYHRLSIKLGKQMRQSSPLFFDEESRTWIVYDFDEIIRIQKDWRTFSPSLHESERSRQSLITMSPPDHTEVRSFVAKAFSAKTMEQMRAKIVSIVDDLLNPLIANGQMEMMEQFANLLPVMALTAILGLPMSQWQQFKKWTEDFMRDGVGSSAGQELTQAFTQAIEARRDSPTEDLLSMIIHTEIDGQYLCFPDLIGFCFTLFIANNITTTSDVLGNAILCLCQHPEIMQELRAHPTLIPSAVEEVLRYMPSFRDALASQLLMKKNRKKDTLVTQLSPGGRIVTTDTVIAGKNISKGDLVRINYLATNFDEKHFSQPEVFDIKRSPNPYQTFGHGIHTCLGAPLSRLEVQVALQLLLSRITKLRIIDSDALKQKASAIVFGAEKLPVQFEKLPN